MSIMFNSVAHNNYTNVICFLFCIIDRVEKQKVSLLDEEPFSGCRLTSPFVGINNSLSSAS